MRGRVLLVVSRHDRRADPSPPSALRGHLGGGPGAHRSPCGPPAATGVARGRDGVRGSAGHALPHAAVHSIDLRQGHGPIAEAAPCSAPRRSSATCAQTWWWPPPAPPPRWRSLRPVRPGCVTGSTGSGPTTCCRRGATAPGPAACAAAPRSPPRPALRPSPRRRPLPWPMMSRLAPSSARWCWATARLRGGPGHLLPRRGDACGLADGPDPGRPGSAAHRADPGTAVVAPGPRPPSPRCGCRSRLASRRHVC